MSDGQWALVNVAVAVVSILAAAVVLRLVERRAMRMLAAGRHERTRR